MTFCSQPHCFSLRFWPHCAQSPLQSSRQTALIGSASNTCSRTIGSRSIFFPSNTSSSASSRSKEPARLALGLVLRRLLFAAHVLAPDQRLRHQVEGEGHRHVQRHVLQAALAGRGHMGRELPFQQHSAAHLPQGRVQRRGPESPGSRCLDQPLLPSAPPGAARDRWARPASAPSPEFVQSLRASTKRPGKRARNIEGGPPKSQRAVVHESTPVVTRP